MVNKAQQLLNLLLIEMVQTEHSATRHPRKEAARLSPGDPPAGIMHEIARHADRALPQFESLTSGWRQELGKVLGETFTTVRSGFLDLIVSHEKSYRGTLAGLHHGIDCALLTQAAATAAGRLDVAALCQRWLDERRPLVEECQRQLAWFAAHPELALERATPHRIARARSRKPASSEHSVSP